MHHPVKDFFKRLQLDAILSENEIDRSLPYFKVIELKKGDYLSKEGEVCRMITIVQKGVLRSFYDKDGEQLTTYFNIEGSIATALRSFLKEVPALENIQALSHVQLISIQKSDLMRLYHEIPSWNKLARIVMERLYVSMEERSISLQYDTATERYLKFIDDYPHVINQVPLQYIASFIGITPETLSRIRKNLLH